MSGAVVSYRVETRRLNGASGNREVKEGRPVVMRTASHTIIVTNKPGATSAALSTFVLPVAHGTSHGTTHHASSLIRFFDLRIIPWKAASAS